MTVSRNVSMSALTCGAGTLPRRRTMPVMREAVFACAGGRMRLASRRKEFADSCPFGGPLNSAGVRVFAEELWL